MIAAARFPLRNDPAKSQFLRLCQAWHKRKNWLFSDTPKGATASAQLYSLVETAKANGQEPYAWLRHALERLPQASSVEDYEALLPWNCKPRPHS
jgi:hypothetical protein